MTKVIQTQIMLVLAAAVVLFVSASQVMAVVEFNDGGVWDIDYEIADSVWVDYQAPGIQTTVNWLEGASMPSGYWLEAYEDSRINISGGSIGSTLYALGSSQVTVSGGSISYLSASGSSQVDVSGGSIDWDLSARDSTQVAVSGGSMYLLKAYEISQITVSGGSILRLYARDSSQVTVSGGAIGDLVATDSSQVAVSGGSIGKTLYAYDRGQIDVSGGLFGGELLVLENAVLTIHGWDFAVDGMPVGYTELYSIFGGEPWDEPFRQLTGTLLSGDPINNQFRIGNSGKIVLVPEPATLLLLGLGAVMVTRKR